MIKFLNIQPVVLCYCSKLPRISVRTKKNKTISLIRIRKEDKQLFGPMMKTKKDKNNGNKQLKTNVTLLNTSNVIDSNGKNNHSNNCKSNNASNNDNSHNNNNNNNNYLYYYYYNQTELHWIANSKIKIIQFGHKNHEIPQHLKESVSKITDLKLKKSEGDILVTDKYHSNGITVNKTDNKVLQSTDNLNIGNNKITTQKNALYDNNDIFNVSTTLNKRLNVLKELKSNERLKHFPLINTAKADKDSWEDSAILSREVNDENIRLPGVTRILQETMSDKARLILERWKKKMTAELGEEGFAKYMEDQQNSSKIMHLLITNILKNEPAEIPYHLQDTFRSMNLILRNVKNVRLLESSVVHSGLHYRGIVDCVADYRGALCLIDWKKSDKVKTMNTTYDLPLQLSAYVGALNSDPNYPFKVDRGILAIAYSRGQAPSLFEFSSTELKFYWKEWLRRVEKYYSMKFAESL